eukprot:SM000296S11301  [mRNA]  locus=s296:33339:34554:- [translate_table: standard]
MAAATMAASQAVGSLATLARKAEAPASSFVCTRVALRSQPARLSFRRMAIRAEDPLQAIKNAADSTKTGLTADQIKQNMSKESEQKSVMGIKPAGESSSLGRSELERRPETGDRSFQSVMAFDGPGPETINGRLAMLGFFWGLVGEVLSGKTIVQQVSDPNSTGLFWLLALGQVIFYASLVPIFKGESTDSRANGPFNGKSERWNGRLAMIGFAGLLIFEAASGHAFLNWGPTSSVVDAVTSSGGL